MIFTYDTEFKKGISLEINSSGYPVFWDTHELMQRKVTVFAPPIVSKDKLPFNNLTIARVVDLIRSEHFKGITETIRSKPTKTQQKHLKETQFPFVFWSGTFRGRRDVDLVEHSKLICIDVDGLGEDLAHVQSLVNADPCVILSFVSPSGNGLKVVYEIDLTVHNQEKWYKGLSKSIQTLCDLPAQKIDPSCKNPARACFLTYDPNIYVNARYA